MMGDNEHVPAVVQASVLAFRGGQPAESQGLLYDTVFVNTITSCEFPTSHPNDREQTRLAPYFGL